ncbi:MAG: Hsp20/alpha crystallin family protein [Caldisericota bacterium]|nr:Hsp20/alpha crystallin family protein [Caldisericota bacterium]
MMIRYDPFDELKRVEEQMNRLFGSFWGEPRRRYSALPATAARTSSDLAPMGEFYSPAIEVQENTDKYSVKVDLPGIDKKDIHIKVRENVLAISAETKTEAEKNDKRAGNYYSERTYGRYYREIPLGSNIDEEHIKAAHENGVLTLELPKKALPEATSKEISIT